MRVFRIDNRVFSEGDLILPQKKYQSELSDIKLLVENLLEKNRPSVKPNRNEILMVFESFENAKYHWTIQVNSKFYECKIKKGSVLHRGDYNKIEELFKNIKNEEIATRIAGEYWNGIMTENPKIEIFVSSSNIYRIISQLEIERKNAYAIRGGMPARPGVKIINDYER